MTKYSILLSKLQANIEAICCRAICLYNMAVCLLKTYAGMRNLSVILRIQFLAPILLNNMCNITFPLSLFLCLTGGIEIPLSFR
jgi:hypothetical protein